jgi:hypothetical protein
MSQAQLMPSDGSLGSKAKMNKADSDTHQRTTCSTSNNCLKMLQCSSVAIVAFESLEHA